MTKLKIHSPLPVFDGNELDLFFRNRLPLWFFEKKRLSIRGLEKLTVVRENGQQAIPIAIGSNRQICILIALFQTRDQTKAESLDFAFCF
jgi:hypothetical protein